MRNKEDIKELLNYLQTKQDRPLEFDEEAIEVAYQKNNDGQSLPIKILSVFGGLLASLAFLGFLLIAGLYNSDTGLLIFGVLCIAAAIWINKVSNKIITDTVSVSAFIIGFILLGFGFNKLEMSESAISIAFIFIASFSLCIVDSYILSFVSVLVINGSILALIISNNAYDFIHVYVSALALIITYFFLKEAKIMTLHLSKLYSPMRIGLIFSFLSGLIILGKRGILPLLYPTKNRLD